MPYAFSVPCFLRMHNPCHETRDARNAPRYTLCIIHAMHNYVRYAGFVPRISYDMARYMQGVARGTHYAYPMHGIEYA